MSGDPASLERVHDIVTLAPVSWWPLAPGAWAVISILVLAAAVAAILYYLRWRKDAYRRAALLILERSTTSPAALSELLKRTALATFAREDVAPLCGDEWVAFLNRQTPSPLFDESLSRSLIKVTYQPLSSSSAARTAVNDGSEEEALERAAQRWILHHRRGRR